MRKKQIEDQTAGMAGRGLLACDSPDGDAYALSPDPGVALAALPPGVRHRPQAPESQEAGSGGMEGLSRRRSNCLRSTARGRGIQRLDGLLRS